MKGKEFKVGGPYIKTPAGKSRACSDKGLFIGRTTDHQLCKYYTRKLRKLTDPRAKRIAAHLELKLKLKVIAAQIPVTLPEFKLKTSIDLLAIKAPDTAVVLEIKTTQFSLSAHNDRYKRQCIGTPLLQNGIPNCESSHHQLQTAFGILGLKRLLPSDAKVIGRVVVATDEAVQSYPCSESYIKRAHFSLPMQDAMMAKSMAAIRAKLMRLPAAKDSQLKIQRYFQKLGYPLICEGLKCEASFVLCDAVGDPKAKPTKYAVIAMIHDPDVSISCCTARVVDSLTCGGDLRRIPERRPSSTQRRAK